MAGMILWLVFAIIIALFAGLLFFMKRTQPKTQRKRLLIILGVGLAVFALFATILVLDSKSTTDSSSSSDNDDSYFPWVIIWIALIPLFAQNSKVKKPHDKRMAIIIGILLLLVFVGLLVFFAF